MPVVVTMSPTFRLWATTVVNVNPLASNATPVIDSDRPLTEAVPATVFPMSMNPAVVVQQRPGRRDR